MLACAEANISPHDRLRLHGHRRAASGQSPRRRGTCFEQPECDPRCNPSQSTLACNTAKGQQLFAVRECVRLAATCGRAQVRHLARSSCSKGRPCGAARRTALMRWPPLCQRSMTHCPRSQCEDGRVHDLRFSTGRRVRRVRRPPPAPPARRTAARRAMRM